MLKQVQHDEMNERIDSIDCLRGVAILAVLLVHCGQAVAGLPDWLHHLTGYGGRGVQLFFTLSAVTLLMVYRGAPFSSRSFFVRRFFRIAPMFYLGIGFYTVYHGVGSPDGVGLPQVALTLTFLHGWTWESINSLVPGGWSIAAEAMFYVLFPLLLRTVTSLRRSLLAFSIALIISRASFVLIPFAFAGDAPPALLDIFAAFCFPTQLPAFIGGFVVYFAMLRLQRGQVAWARVAWARVAWLVIAGGIVGCALSGDKTLSNYLLADMLLMLLVIAVHVAQPRVILNRLLRYIGRISFSMYLIHFAVLDGVRALLAPLIAHAAPSLQLGLLYLATLLVTAGLATLTWRWVEQPGIALGRGISGRYSVR